MQTKEVGGFPLYSAALRLPIANLGTTQTYDFGAAPGMRPNPLAVHWVAGLKTV